MKKNSKNLSILFGIGITFLSVTAQDKNNNVFQQPSSLIILNSETSGQQKSFQNLFDQHLKLGKGNVYQKTSSLIDDLGITHEKFQQKYKGLKVEFGNAGIDITHGKATAIHGEYYNVKNINTTPDLSKEQALQNAINHIGAKEYLWENETAATAMNYTKPEGELVILPNLDSKNKSGVVTEFNLAYKFDIYATQPISRGYLYIDAHSGYALFYNAIIKHIDEHSNSSKNLISLETKTLRETSSFLDTGNASTRYSGNKTITTRTIGGSFALRDNTRGGGVNTYDSGRSNSYPTTNFTDNDNNWTAAEHDNANKDNAALDAHWGAEVTYDYWSTVHSRNSFNGTGAAINSWVHYDDRPGGAGYDNAFWNGRVMTYGDGSSNGNEGNGFFDALTSLDVAAHEIGHAVTTFTANLAYRRESGGLNEGFSDIWGAAVEHFAKGNGNDATPSEEVWLIGDEIDRRRGSAALRSMSNPKSLGQPDTYRGTNWRPATVAEGCTSPSRPNDFCGVHTNSGVLNHWFYLVTTGSANTDGVNDLGESFTVSGIGIDKAAKIAYRTLNIYLSANSTFADARTGSIQATKDLYGADGAEEIAVTNAWYAVNVGDEYGGSTGGGSSCNSSISSFPYNEGFENTLGDWTQETDGDDINWDVDRNGTPSDGTGPSGATQGSYYIYVEASGNGTGYPNKRAILNSPCFDLSGATNANFTFSYHMFGATNMGSITLEASTDQGVNWASIWNQTGNQGNSWQNATVDLASYVGNEVQLRFNRLTGNTWQADIAIDEIALLTNRSTVTENNNVCDNSLEWDASQNYQVGDRIVYQGSLFERTATEWINLGSCDATTTTIIGDTAFVKIPPFDTTNKIIAYPNPLKGSILMIIKKSLDAKDYEIRNILGQIIQQGKVINSINVEQLETGLYSLKIKNEGVLQFIKQ